VLNDIYNIPLI